MIIILLLHFLFITVYSTPNRLDVRSLQKEYDFSTKMIQNGVINSRQFVPLNITNHWHDNKIDFFNSKPYFDENKNIHIQSYLNNCNDPKVWLKTKFQEDYTDDCNGPCLWLKAKSQDSYKREINNILTNPQKSAQMLNERIFQTELVKYKNNKIDVCYLHDIVYGKRGDDIIKWVNEPLKIEYEKGKNTLYIQSPVMLTEANLLIRRYAGMYYMKLLTPLYAQRIIEKYNDNL